MAVNHTPMNLFQISGLNGCALTRARVMITAYYTMEIVYTDLEELINPFFLYIKNVGWKKMRSNKKSDTHLKVKSQQKNFYISF